MPHLTLICSANWKCMAHRSSHIQQVSKSSFAEHPLCSYHTPGKVYQLCTALSFHLHMFGWTLISPHIIFKNRCTHGPGSMIAKSPGVRQQCNIKNTQKVSLNFVHKLMYKFPRYAISIRLWPTGADKFIYSFVNLVVRYNVGYCSMWML